MKSAFKTQQTLVCLASGLDRLPAKSDLATHGHVVLAQAAQSVQCFQYADASVDATADSNLTATHPAGRTRRQATSQRATRHRSDQVREGRANGSVAGVSLRTALNRIWCDAAVISVALDTRISFRNRDFAVIGGAT
jgi:hypothetical protein